MNRTGPLAWEGMLREAAAIQRDASMRYFREHTDLTIAESKLGPLEAWWMSEQEIYEVLADVCDHGEPMVRCRECCPRYVMAAQVQKIFGRDGRPPIPEDEVERQVWAMFDRLHGDEKEQPK